ncbi:hypothetical protein [Amycolatopsis sp. A1MSW2902]|uniref:hypothetical protein n=1 Tax=Amycolatopsis sp. A1MSW2902 TaxID=687413 RepID=UPI00307D0A3C
MSIATTPGGQPIVCDGCGAPVETVTAAMRHPVPHEVAHAVYGKDNRDGDLVYIVCAPLPGAASRAWTWRCSPTNATNGSAAACRAATARGAATPGRCEPCRA